MADAVTIRTGKRPSAELFTSQCHTVTFRAFSGTLMQLVSPSPGVHLRKCFKRHGSNCRMSRVNQEICRIGQNG